MKSSIPLLLMFFCANISAAQSLLEPSDIAFGKIVGTQSFEGKALYGYIDGGAELYHEYGFVRLSVYTIAIGTENFAVELYEMKNASAAFGIYSVNRNQCLSVDTTYQFFCLDPYQIQSALGVYYVRISNESGARLPELPGRKIAEIIHRKFQSPPVVIPAVFQSAELRPFMNSLRRMNGILGVQNGAPELEGALDGAGMFELWTQSVVTDSLQADIVDVSFESVGSAQAFAQNCGLEDGKSFSTGRRAGTAFSVWRKNDRHVIVLKSPQTPPKSIMQILHAYQPQ